MNAQAIWEKASGHLRGTLSKDIYDRWIAVIEARAISDTALTLSVANNFYQSWLEENYVPLIRSAVAAVTGQEYEILLAVDRTARDTASGDAAAVEIQPSAAEVREVREVRERAPASNRHAPVPALNAKYTFDHVRGRSLQQLLPRGRAGRRPVAGAGLQSAVHLRRGGVWARRT
jgi:chromosomal replication initiation ATPase DnaA